MPGLAGIISKLHQKRNKQDVSLMIDCMMHETYYNSGTYINDQLGLYVGWVCHKGSFSDCMPIFNETKDLILFFIGEDFAEKELINRLKSQGHEFDSSNASYLIHQYEEEGEGFLQRLNGWFSGILVDLRKKTVVLFNDRYGMQRIYYHRSNDAFYFSSEAKSLLKVLPELRKINMESLGQFFACDCVLKNSTLFSNIFLLPGGSKWTFIKGDVVKMDHYFNLSTWENKPILEKGLFYERFKETFNNILPHYFHAKDPVGMSLTGGLDTRMIMASLNGAPGSLPCYTFGGMYRDYFDVRVARKVADACHQTHHALRLDQKFFSDFPSCAERTIYITDGCHDVMGAHDIYFNRLAREIAPIRVTGKFGSEVLKSVTTFKVISLFKRLFHPDFNKFIHEAKRTHADISKGHERSFAKKLSFAVFKEVPWHEYGRLALEQSQLTLRTPYMDNNLVSLFYQFPAHAFNDRDISLRLIADNNPALFKIMTDRGLAGTSNYFFSKCVHMIYWSLFKAEWYYTWQIPHWLAKLDYIFAPLHLEKLILGRQQLCHYRIWFRDELSDYVQKILLDKRSTDRPYLNKGFLEEMVSGHIKGNRNYINEINKVLTVELIQRLLIENI